MAQTEKERRVQKLKDLVADIRVAMLTSVEEDGSLRSRPMWSQRVEFDGQLWFFTSAGSMKVHEIEREQHVNVSFADPRREHYVSISGRAVLVRDRTKAEQMWSPMLRAFFPRGLDDPDLALIRVDVDRAEYWDVPSNRMVQLAGLARAVLTGKPYAAGEHEKVDLH